MIRRALLSIAIASVPPAASAHSWYPAQCCHDRDCMPADAIEVDISGGRTVLAGSYRVSVPPDFVVQPSEDERIHVCFEVVEDLAQPLLRCLFLPAQS